MTKVLSCSQARMNRLAAAIRELHRTNKPRHVITYMHEDIETDISMMRWASPRYIALILWDSGEPYSILCIHKRSGRTTQYLTFSQAPSSDTQGETQ
jgi:hypothetical protein